MVAAKVHSALFRALRALAPADLGVSTNVLIDKQCPFGLIVAEDINPDARTCKALDVATVFFWPPRW
jgi:hypothetical protein